MTQRKVALVTGSGKRRVGWHVADALAGRGYALVVHYRTSAAEAAETVGAFQRPRRRGRRPAGRPDRRDAGPRADRAECWSTSAGSTCWSTAPPSGRASALEDVTAADVRAYFETNTLGTFLCCQQAGLAMVQPAGGRLHRHPGRLGRGPALPELRRLLPLQGGHPDADALPGGRAGHAATRRCASTASCPAR